MTQLANVPEPQTSIYAIHDDASSDHAPTLRDFIAILKRRKAIAIQAFVVVVALGVVVTLMTKPIYRSTARVLVEGKAAVMAINNTSNPLASLLMPSVGHRVETQVEILRSSDIAVKASKKSGVPLGVAFLDVQHVGDTDVISLSTSSTSPDSAYEYLKAVPDVYLKDLREKRMSEVSAALDFAQKRLTEEKARLSKNEIALQKFRESRNVIDPEVQRKGDLEAATTARGDLSTAEAKADSLSAQLQAFIATKNSLPPEIANPSTTTNSAELQTLRQKIDELKSQRQNSLYLYKPTDDEIRKIDRQITDLQDRLQRTPRDVTTTTRLPNPAIAEYDQKIADTRADLSAAQVTLNLLRSRATTLTKGLNRYNPIERVQGQIQREITSSTESVTALSQSVDDLEMRKKAMESSNDQIEVIESASQPYKVSPNVQRNIMLAIALGLLLGCGAAMLQESLDDHLRDEEEVRRLLGVPILGHFPMMPEGHSALPSILRAAQQRALQSGSSLVQNGTAPMSENGVPLDMPTIELEHGNGYSRGGYAAGSDRNLLEKFRVLRSNVQFTLVDRPHSTLLVTSSVPQEGKSYTTSNLAAAMALDGRRVILIDADLHRPRQHEVFDMPVQPGLTNILVGQAQLKDCLRETGINNLRLLPAGILPPNPVELLNSPSMEAVMETLKYEADILIFDSPPLLATADAQVLASKVDGVLYVMQLGRVPKSAIARSFELLAQARANVLGVVLNKIDAQASRGGDYGGYYYGGYRGGYGHSNDRNGHENGTNGSMPHDADDHMNDLAEANKAEA